MTTPAKCDAKKTQLLPVLWLENSWTARISIQGKGNVLRTLKTRANAQPAPQPAQSSPKYS